MGVWTQLAALRSCALRLPQLENLATGSRKGPPRVKVMRVHTDACLYDYQPSAPSGSAATPTAAGRQDTQEVAVVRGDCSARNCHHHCGDSRQ